MTDKHWRMIADPVRAPKEAFPPGFDEETFEIGDERYALKYLEEWSESGDDRWDAVEDTCWAPKRNGVGGWSARFWMPREGTPAVDTRLWPVKALQRTKIPAVWQKPGKSISGFWDGIPGHTPRLQPYCFYNQYMDFTSQMAIDIRRLSRVGAELDGKEIITTENLGTNVSAVWVPGTQMSATGERTGQIIQTAVPERMDSWGPGGG